MHSCYSCCSSLNFPISRVCWLLDILESLFLVSLVFLSRPKTPKTWVFWVDFWRDTETPSQSHRDMFAALRCQGPEELTMCRHQRKAMRQGKYSDLLSNFIFLIFDAWVTIYIYIYSNYSERVCSWQWLFTLASHDLTSAYPREAEITRQEIHAWQLFETTMEGGLRLILITCTTSTYAGCMWTVCQCCYIVFSCWMKQRGSNKILNMGWW